VIKLLGKIPREITVAFSGGIDSTVLIDFLRRNHNVTAAFFDHGTTECAQAREFVSAYCGAHGITLKVGEISTQRQPGISPEEHWRRERYQWFYNLGPVVTAHNLNDVVETWIWSSLHGTPSIIPYSHANVFRPLLTTSKVELKYWAQRNYLTWCEDESNRDTRYTRNYIRHEMMPHVLRVNPGIATMLRKRIIKRGTKLDEYDVDTRLKV
jgi:tRNA(Ile)-lysidine synthase